MTSTNEMSPYSRKILIRMLIALILSAILLLLNYDLLSTIYLSNQLTHVGIIINGGIFALFIAGMVKMALGLAYYAKEEQALRTFVECLDDGNNDPAADIASDSVIARRYTTMQRLFNHNTPINHSAMAASLLARESTRGGTPRFINNILILGGVFGTIVSLSIALVGASDMLQNAISSSGMGMVIHGMSTALATTITAILCYMLHGYFFNAFGDVQTNFLGSIEEVTSIRLMPMFQIEQKTIDYRIADLLKAMAEMIRRIDDGQGGVLSITERLEVLLDRLENEHSDVKSDLGDIRKLLRDGFRLPGEEIS
ncbi:MAG: hypothetical protein COW19_01735 [Zetaproteobacteria bacterium CG12_big_fil_rev_8_21_14_0_65_55_1124]|nr:MAG: hypothetical protein AUJ58_09865 [Zetaproteobacteria bacterium CG1_02_55_237]PIS19988.1 MAG: hypothetical protein COT53_03075 [Zetaproteobacteria bacterium CG08_land_8_20_14_0_20_55_17]PIW43590.1 MAG: hypothetical protein COW19_01735 [Zetaproteobacteria bacterium CG12_big_fil_rev_8_21_14_0_65_55_1124]PIZ37926.1 MAG: hypothetical protein COY36_08190 [Zetaproteobacteria bacterium CG_4_10_14_0_2_um_filter_55_20]PJB80530.1 MAG: hypothetical protein CO089_07355 [Zetaproteobacteria bacterium 